VDNSRLRIFEDSTKKVRHCSGYYYSVTVLIVTVSHRSICFVNLPLSPTKFTRAAKEVIQKVSMACYEHCYTLCIVTVTIKDCFCTPQKRATSLQGTQ
jgi:hypothetical protein